MKIPGVRRKALSQSTDVLLILTATLAVGGIMYGVATGLIGGMGNISSLQVTSSSIHVGTSSSSLTASIKNSGNTILTGTATITVSGASFTAAQTFTATGGDTGGQAVAWSCPATTASTLTFETCITGISVTLKPGDVLSLSFYTSGGFTAGSTYQINGGAGSVTFATSALATSA